MDDDTTYQRSARELDTRFYAPPQTPVHDRLLSFGQIRCLVFGAYGEASPDVHHSITAAATRRAQRSWRHLGARSQHEARAFFLQGYRRDVGMAVVREHARVRLARVPFIGEWYRFLSKMVPYPIQRISTYQGVSRRIIVDTRIEAYPVHRTYRVRI